MRTKLFSLPEATLMYLVELESQMMIPILARSGIHVTEQEIKTEVFRDQEQEVLISFRGEEPAAWIRYKIEDSCLFVKSIQLRLGTNSPGALRGLLRETLAALKGNSAVEIKSLVQTANAKSIVLHEKLGFNRIKEGQRAIQYSISAEVLKSNLKRLFRAD